MRITNVELFGVTYSLYLSCRALFDIEEKHGADWLDKMGERNKEAFDVSVDAFCILANQASAFLVNEGYKASPQADAEVLKAQLIGEDPYMWTYMKTGIYTAFNEGLSRDVDEKKSEEVDVYLIEIERKNRKNAECTQE